MMPLHQRGERRLVAGAEPANQIPFIDGGGASRAIEAVRVASYRRRQRLPGLVAITPFRRALVPPACGADVM